VLTLKKFARIYTDTCDLRGTLFTSYLFRFFGADGSQVEIWEFGWRETWHWDCGSVWISLVCRIEEGRCSGDWSSCNLCLTASWRTCLQRRHRGRI